MDAAHTALQSLFGFEAFRPGQAEAVQAVTGPGPPRDVLVVMPTGAGKSLCYQLPALMRDDLTVVVSPLVSLMQDQVEGLERVAPGRAALINAQQDAGTNRAAMARAAAGEVRLLYIAPERFSSPGFAEALRAAHVGLFVVDEAHCVSQWGHDFRPDYFRLADAARWLGAQALVASTATATPQVAADIVARLGLRDPVRVTTGFDRPNLSFAVVPCRGAADKRARIAAALAQRRGAPGDRLCRHARGDRGPGRRAGGRARDRGARLPRRPRAPGARRRPAALHGRRRRGRGGHQRVRHGRRQVRRADLPGRPVRLPAQRRERAARPRPAEALRCVGSYARARLRPPKDQSHFEGWVVGPVRLAAVLDLLQDLHGEGLGHAGRPRCRPTGRRSGSRTCRWPRRAQRAAAQAQPEGRHQPHRGVPVPEVRPRDDVGALRATRSRRRAAKVAAWRPRSRDPPRAAAGHRASTVDSAGGRAPVPPTTSSPRCRSRSC